ncbi:MAG: prenyltransferase/squalene oxidase repeat-containing protein [Planctomycetota bacterium]
MKTPARPMRSRRALALSAVLPLALFASCSSPGPEADGAADAASADDLVGARDAALDWLAAHQEEQGGWDVDAFWSHDPPEAPTDGAGHPLNDIGVTALAILAHVEAGHTAQEGERSAVVERAVAWLLEQQNEETGLIGSGAGVTHHYDHAIATYALAEVQRAGGSPGLDGALREAAEYVARARNPYGVWRYSMPPNGENDTSVTIWMALATRAVRDLGLRTDAAALDDTLLWLDEMTEPDSGRVGYVERGSRSSRVPGKNDAFPRESTEALTAGAMVTRFALGQELATMPHSDAQTELLLASLPSPDGSTDHLYWHFGTRAMHAAGGARWDRWRTAVEPLVLARMRDDGSFAGSWDPNGAWGYSGGRVYATALMALVLNDCVRGSEEG